MFKKCVISALLITFVGVGSVRADLLMFDLAFNVNGTIDEYIYDYDLSAAANGDNATTMMSGIEGYSSSTLDYETGLGTITFAYDAPGDYSVVSFFDIDMSEDENTYWNESAEVFGTSEVGLSWEVDEPGYEFGDIRTYSINGDEYVGNFENNTLDNYNAIEEGWPNDVSVALGWDFALADAESAVITYSISNDMPTNGFFITHDDLASDEHAYFTTNLAIQSIPEPVTGSLIALGLIIIGLFEVRKKR